MFLSFLRELVFLLVSVLQCLCLCLFLPPSLPPSLCVCLTRTAYLSCLCRSTGLSPSPVICSNLSSLSPSSLYSINQEHALCMYPLQHPLSVGGGAVSTFFASKQAQTNNHLLSQGVQNLHQPPNHTSPHHTNAVALITLAETPSPSGGGINPVRTAVRTGSTGKETEGGA